LSITTIDGIGFAPCIGTFGIEKLLFIKSSHLKEAYLDYQKEFFHSQLFSAHQQIILEEQALIYYE
jgi:hypothetical protein